MGKNADSVRRGIELFNQRNIPGLMDLYDPAAEVVAQGTVTGGAFKGKAGLQEWFTKIGSTFPQGVRLKVENLYETGDAVIVEWSSKGKLANGNDFEGKALNVLEFRGDKIAKHRMYTDTERLARAAGKL